MLMLCPSGNCRIWVHLIHPNRRQHETEKKASVRIWKRIYSLGIDTGRVERGIFDTLALQRAFEWCNYRQQKVGNDSRCQEKDQPSFKRLMNVSHAEWSWAGDMTHLTMSISQSYPKARNAMKTGFSWVWYWQRAGMMHTKIEDILCRRWPRSDRTIRIEWTFTWNWSNFKVRISNCSQWEQ